LRGFAAVGVLTAMLGSLAEAAQHSCAAKSAAASATELLEVSGVFARARADTSEIVARLRAENPKVPGEFWSRFAERVGDPDTLASLYGPIYLHHLSHEDVCALVTFYRSPAGAHFLQIDPRSGAQALAATVILEVLESSQGDAAQSDESRPTPAEPPGKDVAAIHELLKISGTLATARKGIERELDRLRNGPQQFALPASFWEDVRRRLSNDDEMLRLWTPAYAQQLTSAEVLELLAFFHSPVGMRYVAAIPAIQAETLDAGTQLGRDAAKRSRREVFGPLPQWRLMHPKPQPDGE
jgi:hypothetical protein